MGSSFRDKEILIMQNSRCEILPLTTRTRKYFTFFSVKPFLEIESKSFQIITVEEVYLTDTDPGGWNLGWVARRFIDE